MPALSKTHRAALALAPIPGPSSVCTSLPYRLASAFGVIHLRNGKVNPLICADVLKRKKSSKSPHIAEGAGLALAALGELDWRAASRRERAAYVLGVLARHAKG